MIRHFTVSGFVVDNARTALHWHPKLSLWLPPGGHIEADEDPVQAVLREVLEETGITAEVVPHRQPYTFRNVTQLPSPFSIIVADVVEGDETHQHIDMAYVVRPVPGALLAPTERDHGWVWMTEAELRADAPMPVISCGVEAPVPHDVREVALAAISLVRETFG